MAVLPVSIFALRLTLLNVPEGFFFGAPKEAQRHAEIEMIPARKMAVLLAGFSIMMSRRNFLGKFKPKGPACNDLLLLFAMRALLDEAPSLLPPFALSHTGRVVEEFFGGIFLV